MTQPASIYGTCLATLPNASGVIDLTPDMRMATGIAVLAQSLIRRQTTPRGTVITSPNDCIDIRQILSKGISQSDVATFSRTIRAELLRDTRVSAASVSITMDTTTGACTIVETIQSSSGPFSLTLTLSAGTIAAVIAGQ